MSDTPVLEVVDLVKHFSARRSTGKKSVVRAIDGVSFAIGKGEILGLVGESGSGKSTVGKCVTGLTQATSGSIKIMGTEITNLSRAQMRPMRKLVHIVFQDPYSSLNPRMTIGEIVREPLNQHRVGSGQERDERVAEMLERCGVNRDLAERYPHELSGGQRQRVALARALILEPSLVIADEPVSALDVSVQASILNLLLDLQKDMGFSCLFITHDLSVVDFISDRVAVMYLGKIMETGTREEIFSAPQHPYTQSLLSAAPTADPRHRKENTRIVLSGSIPSPSVEIPGCVFASRCPVAQDICRTLVPALTERLAPDHLTACHLVTPENGAPQLVAQEKQ